MERIIANKHGVYHVNAAGTITEIKPDQNGKYFWASAVSEFEFHASENSPLPPTNKTGQGEE